MHVILGTRIVIRSSDPEVAAAIKDISSNPAKIRKYNKNPKIMSIVHKLASKLGEGKDEVVRGGPGPRAGLAYTATGGRGRNPNMMKM